jgi:hypothetical protein
MIAQFVFLLEMWIPRACFQMLYYAAKIEGGPFQCMALVFSYSGHCCQEIRQYCDAIPII